MLRSSIFLFLFLLAPAAVHAAVVSFDIGTQGVTPLASTDEAGVIAVTNWNNVGGTGQTTDFTNAIDDSGAATGIDISITSAEGVRWGGNHFHGQVAGANANMMRDIAYENGAGDTFNVAFDDIGYDNYDVYLYTGAKFEAWGGSISNGGTSYFIRGAETSPNFVQGTETGSFANATSADYVKFSNLSGDSQDFEFRVDAQQIYFAGAQIVSLDVAGPAGPSSSTGISAVPEPSSAIALLLIGSAGVLRRRRRK